MLQGLLFKRKVHGDSCVVDYDVDFAIFGDGGIDQFLRSGCSGKICFYGYAGCWERGG